MYNEITLNVGLRGSFPTSVIAENGGAREIHRILLARLSRLGRKSIQKHRHLGARINIEHRYKHLDA